jgi:hypothetical protein
MAVTEAVLVTGGVQLLERYPPTRSTCVHAPAWRTCSPC